MLVVRLTLMGSRAVLLLVNRSWPAWWEEKKCERDDGVLRVEWVRIFRLPVERVRLEILSMCTVIWFTVKLDGSSRPETMTRYEIAIHSADEVGGFTSSNRQMYVAFHFTKGTASQSCSTTPVCITRELLRY